MPLFTHRTRKNKTHCLTALALISVFVLPVPPSYATQLSCSAATSALRNIQNEMVQQRRDERTIRTNLNQVRTDFQNALRKRNEWKRAIRTNRCHRSDANQRKCLKAEREVAAWNREMRNLQREESALLRRQNKNNYNSIRAREVRAERNRAASCNGLPAPRAATTTEAERRANALARDLAIGAAIGILGGIMNRGGGHSHGGGNCRNNPLGANC